jgi:hypothetical protein
MVPHGEYRRKLEDADFSLEANTPSVPHDGHFYVLRGGRVLMETENFGDAMQSYKNLCREHWLRNLESDDPQRRLASAWGLLGINPEDKIATEVINRDGDNAARDRLNQMRKRRRYAKIQAGRQRARAS